MKNTVYEQLKKHADHEVEFHIKDSNEFDNQTKETQGFSQGAPKRLLLDIEYKVIGHCNTCNKEILNCSVDSPEWSGAAEAIGSIWGKCQDAAPASAKED